MSSAVQELTAHEVVNPATEQVIATVLSSGTRAIFRVDRRDCGEHRRNVGKRFGVLRRSTIIRKKHGQ